MKAIINLPDIFINVIFKLFVFLNSNNYILQHYMQKKKKIYIYIFHHFDIRNFWIKVWLLNQYSLRDLCILSQE